MKKLTLHLFFVFILSCLLFCSKKDPVSTNENDEHEETKKVLAYICAEFDGLLIVDVTKPDNPQLISTYKDFSTVNSHFGDGLAIKNNYAFISNAYKLAIIDISDIKSPAYKRSLVPIDAGDIWDYKIIENSLFISANNYNNGLSSIIIYDITDPLNFIEKERFDLYDEDIRFENFIVNDNKIYFNYLKGIYNSDSRDTSRIGTLDINAMSNSFSLSDFSREQSGSPSRVNFGIYNEEYLIATYRENSTNTNSMIFFNITTNPSHPDSSFTFDLNNNTIYEFLIENKYAYLCGPGVSFMQIYISILDLSHISNIREVGKTIDSELGWLHDIFMKDNLVYMVGTGGLSIYDISSLSSIKFKSVWKGEGDLNGIIVR